MLQVTLKLTDGTYITVNLESDMPTIDDVRQALIDQHSFARSVQIMSGAAILKGSRKVDEFPYGSLLVVGQKVGGGHRPLSPQPEIRHTHTHAHPPHHHSHQQASPPTKSPQRQQAPVSPTSGAPATPAKDSVVRITAVVPDLQKRLQLDLAHDSTLADLITAAIAKEPSLLGCKVVVQGRVVSGPSKTISSLAIIAGDTVYLASGSFSNPNHLLLYQINDEYLAVKHELESNTVTAQRKKGLYEQLMRALFRTDDLTDLEDEWRARRKQLVKDITALQDCLHGDIAAN